MEQSQNSKFNQLLIRTFTVPLIMLVIMWLVRTVEAFTTLDFAAWGILPRSIKGLPGIVTSIFVHGDWKHLWSNSISFLVLAAALFFFYRKVAYKTLLLLTLITGFWVWVSARENYHIGASGLIYGLASFLLVAGIVSKNRRLAALSLLISLFYGGMWWGVLPVDGRISWESHLAGALAGIVVAMYLRNALLQVKPPFDEEEEEDKDLKMSAPHADLIGDEWKINPYEDEGKIEYPSQSQPTVRFIFKPKEEEGT